MSGKRQLPAINFFGEQGNWLWNGTGATSAARGEAWGANAWGVGGNPPRGLRDLGGELRDGWSGHISGIGWGFWGRGLDDLGLVTWAKGDAGPAEYGKVWASSKLAAERVSPCTHSAMCLLFCTL